MNADQLKDETMARRVAFLNEARTSYIGRAGWSVDLCNMPLSGPVCIKTEAGHPFVAEHQGFGYFREIGVRQGKYKLRAHPETVFITEIIAWAPYDPSDDSGEE